jgi:hypothetical protein
MLRDSLISPSADCGKPSLLQMKVTTGLQMLVCCFEGLGKTATLQNCDCAKQEMQEA